MPPRFPRRALLRSVTTLGGVVLVAGASLTAVRLASDSTPTDGDTFAMPSATPRSPLVDAYGSPAATSPTATPTPTTSPTPVPTVTAAPTAAPTVVAQATSRPAPATTPKASTVSSSGVALPLRYSTGSATQVITVVAKSTGSKVATLQAWDKRGSGWVKHGGSMTAHIGTQGMTASPSESKSATPMGTYSLTQAFGAKANPGTSLPYFKTTSADWWISQSGPLYNTHQRCSSSCAFSLNPNTNEHLAAITPYYHYAVVIDYNRSPVKQGAGSAFFLHVSKPGEATAGCVSIVQDSLVSIMKWLSPSRHPRILIGTA